MDKTVEKITEIIKNRPLAQDIKKSVSFALNSNIVCFSNHKNVLDVFNNSLSTAIRDIEHHPKGALFRRLLEYGPHHPDDPESLVSDEKTILSDPECGACINFIYCYMVNRFKGELAELLALKSCVMLIHKLQKQGTLTQNLQIYWGSTIRERRRIRTSKSENGIAWGGYALGADGILAEISSRGKKSEHDQLNIHGIVEIKSFTPRRGKVSAQIDKHISRMQGGVILNNREWAPENIHVVKDRVIRIIIAPATWKINREYYFEEQTDGSRKMVFPSPEKPPLEQSFQEISNGLWGIKLPWSKEALEQAAYEMTFWYMSQVGKHIYERKKLPTGWENMTPEQAGYNAIKMMLYYVMLRYITKQQDLRATKIYNIYCFGYPIGVDSKEMLWPEDLTKQDK